MTGLKEYKAYVLSIQKTDEIMRAAFGVDDGVYRRGDALSYELRFRNEKDREAFQARMAGHKVFHWELSSDVPEETAIELLTEQLGLGPILRTFVDGDDQVILAE